MAESERLDPVAYLDRFFDELRNEVRSNPKLASRLVKALGAEVVFDDEDKAEVANPFVLAAAGDKARFYSIFSPLKVTQIKRILKENNLATPVDMRGKKAPELIDLMYSRAEQKVSERQSSIY